MKQEYFKATIKDKFLRPKTVKIRTGLFKYREEERMDSFLKCQIEGTDWLIVIPCEAEVYDIAEIGYGLSIYLSFKYEYSCFHFLPSVQKTKEIVI